MDNAIEINEDLTHKEVALFLGDELKNHNNESVKSYNLEEEYAKTARHKKPFVWILLGLCFFIVGAGTLTTTGLVSHSNHKISINIDSFDDLNLRALLNSAGRAQNLYDTAVKNKESLIQNKKDELSQAEQKRNMDLFTLQSVASVSTKAFLAKEHEKIEEEYKTAVNEINRNYEPKITEAEEEIKHYESKRNSYNSEKLNQAKDAQATIDSTKQLHDIEMKAQEDRYEKKIKELREELASQKVRAAREQKAAVEEVRKIFQAKIDLLDPRAREQNKEQNEIILDAGIQNKTKSSKLWDNVEKLTFNENDYTSENSSFDYAETIKEAAKELEETRTLALRFKPIPLENSIKDYVPAIMHQTYQVANNLAESGFKMQEELRNLQDFAETSLASSSADGIVFKNTNSSTTQAYIKKTSRDKITDGKSLGAQISHKGKQIDATIQKQDGIYIVTMIYPEEDSSKPQTVYSIDTGDPIRILPQKSK